MGADAKIGITPSPALDLTVNTDFARVEVDDQQVERAVWELPNRSRVGTIFTQRRSTDLAGD